MSAQRFRKRPVVIEAMQFLGDFDAVDQFVAPFQQASGVLAISFQSDALVIHTLEGDMVANHGDWIIRGVKGEFYPCKPDIFAATYEAVG